MMNSDYEDYKNALINAFVLKHAVFIKRKNGLQASCHCALGEQLFMCLIWGWGGIVRGQMWPL